MEELGLGIFILCSAAAVLGGFIDAIAGGGGLVTMPALLISGIPPHSALAVNKVSALLGTSVATWVFARNGLILWRLALFGALFSLIGTWLGSTLALHIDTALLGKILIMMLPIGLVITLLPSHKAPQARPSAPVSKICFFGLMPLVCLAIGAYDGFFGPGTGSFLIIALHWIIALPLLQASGTAKVLNLASNFGSALVFIWHGQVIWPLGFSMVAGCVAGNWLGSRLAVRIGAKAVRKFLALSLGLLLITLLVQYLMSPSSS